MRRENRPQERSVCVYARSVRCQIGHQISHSNRKCWCVAYGHDLPAGHHGVRVYVNVRASKSIANVGQTMCTCSTSRSWRWLICARVWPMRAVRLGRALGWRHVSHEICRRVWDVSILSHWGVCALCTPTRLERRHVLIYMYAVNRQHMRGAQCNDTCCSVLWVRALTLAHHQHDATKWSCLKLGINDTHACGVSTWKRAHVWKTHTQGWCALC